jgi:hypothetical protein
MFSYQTVTWSGISGGLSDIRYLFAVLPFCAGCMAVLLGVLHRGFGALFAMIILGLMLCSTMFSLNIGNQPVRWTLPGFLYEIHRDYTTPYDTAVAYIKEHAAKNDILYSIPEYTQGVFHFYVGDSIRMGSQLRRENLKLPVEELVKAGYPVCIEDYYPQWLVAFSMQNDAAQYLDFFSRGRFAYALDRHIGVFWQDRTRPELPWHSFVPVPMPPDPNAGIYIFRRIDKPVQPAAAPEIDAMQKAVPAAPASAVQSEIPVNGRLRKSRQEP